MKKKTPWKVREIYWKNRKTLRGEKKRRLNPKSSRRLFFLVLKVLLSLVTVAASEKKVSSERGHLTMNETSTSNRRGSVDGVFQRCGLCSLLSSLVRRAMCVGSRRGSGESYYQELAETVVSFKWKFPISRHQHHLHFNLISFLFRNCQFH